MDQSPSITFTCNICSADNTCPVQAIERETASCTHCGSTLRMRAIMALLAESLFGRALPLDRFPHRKDIRGIGLSDWDEYARRLADRLDYTNTWYHAEPRLDITAIDDAMAGTCDFLIATDVFEHVAPPVGRAFAGARRPLKPGGVLVLTVPFAIEHEHTIEHFPDLYDWRLDEEAEGHYVLHNRCRDGRRQRFDDLIFHGGPGSTLEMRLFARAALLRDLEAAGFHDIRLAGQSFPEYGVSWPHEWSIPVTARA